MKDISCCHEWKHKLRCSGAPRAGSFPMGDACAVHHLPGGASTFALVDNRALTYSGHEPTTTVFDAHRLRHVLRGRWLYMFGDSSCRGLFLSLAQQLVPGNGWLGAGGGVDLYHLGWGDAIVDAAAAAVVHLRVGSKTGKSGVTPVPDSSAALSQQWRENRSRCIRITWRYATMARYLRHDPFRELQASAAHTLPDVHMLQMGSWDDAHNTPAAAYAAQLQEGMVHWRERAGMAANQLTLHDLSLRRPSTLLAFATAPVPMHQGAHADACGSWQASFFADPAWANATQGVLFLNRVLTATGLEASLKGACACLSVAARTRWRASMQYHPPHVHNLVDTQRLIGMLVHEWGRDARDDGHGGRTDHEGGREASHEGTHEGGRRRHDRLELPSVDGGQLLGGSGIEGGDANRTLTIPLDTPFREGCCCEMPSNETLYGELHDSSSRILMWWNTCRVRPFAGGLAAVIAN